MQPLFPSKKPVDKNEVDRAVNTLVSAIIEAGGAEAIYLFGSTARGTMTTQSDIDLLIVIEKPSDIKPMKRKLRNIQQLTSFPVDLVWIDRQQFEKKKLLGGVCMIAFEDGILCYPKGVE